MRNQVFLDKEIGFKFTTKEKTITTTDLLTYYNLLEQKEDLFISETFAKSTTMNFKGKIVSGFFLIGVMFAELDVPTLGGGYTFNAVLMEMTDIKFMSPAYEGDDLRVSGELIDKRTTSKGHVVVKWRWTLINQNDEAIVTGVNTELFSKDLQFS